MSTIVTCSPANQDRPLLPHPPRRSSDQRRIRTLLDLLTIEKMDGGDRATRQGENEGEVINNISNNNNNNSRWKVLKERLGLNVINCCGIITWRYDDNSTSSPLEEEEENININVNININNVVQQEEEEEQSMTRQQEVVGSMNDQEGMNLAAALAAERQFRAAESGEDEGGGGGGGGGELSTPSRVSLMRLLEETSDGCDLTRDRSNGGGEGSEFGGGGGDTVCCVCMGRKKGAAFIPCGHTYCRVCSRELWLNRGSCPLCNRRILEILDIF